MTNEDDSKNPSHSSLVSDRLKAKRKLLGINYQELSEAFDISAEEIERIENPKFPDPEIISDNIVKIPGIKKYLIEISDPEKNCLGARELDLFDFDGIDLLFEQLKNTYDYVIEFCGRIKPGKELYDEFDKVSHEDNNVLEITSIKKIKNNNDN